MKKRAKEDQNNQRKTWTTGKNLMILSAFYLLLLAIFVYHFTIPDLRLFPESQQYQYGAFSDESIGGESTILESSVADTLYLRFGLDERFSSPYVGFSIGQIGGEGTINLSRYNMVKIKARVENLRGLSISLFAPHSYDRVSEETLLSSSLDFGPSTSTQSIRLGQLRIPDWWYYTHEIKETESIEADLSQVKNLNIGSVQKANQQGLSSFTIYSIDMTRDNLTLYWLLALLAIFFPILLILVQKVYQGVNQSSTKLTVEYKPTSGDSDEKEGFMDYINNHFYRSELTLEEVARETGVYDRKISQYIQDNYQCNFKAYLNNIRIAESKRLLLDTDLNAGEIAFKVGFNNQSHFNRVFKNLEGMSPFGYRNVNK